MTDPLTSEALRKSFKNSFELTLFAIEMGRHCLRSGVSSLEEIVKEVRRHPSKDYLEQLKEMEDFEKQEASKA